MIAVANDLGPHLGDLLAGLAGAFSERSVVVGLDLAAVFLGPGLGGGHLLGGLPWVHGLSEPRSYRYAGQSAVWRDLVRDSEDPDVPVITFRAGQFAAFLRETVGELANAFLDIPTCSAGHRGESRRWRR